MPQVNIRISEEEKEILESIAEKRKTSVSEVVRQQTRWAIEFDDFLQEKVTGLSKGLRIEESAVVQNLLIRLFAFREARRRVYKNQAPEDFPEFVIADGELLTGKKLFNFLVELFENEERQNLRNAKERRGTQEN